MASQVKQYSTDVAAMVVALWAVLRLRHQPSGVGGTLVAAIAGAAAAWFSHAAMFGLAGVGAALAVSAVIGRRRADRRRALAIGAGWALGAGLAAALALRNVPPADLAYLEWYWSGGLMPFPPPTFDDALWLWRRLTWLFGTFATELRRSNGGLGYPWSSLFALLAIAGIAGLFQLEPTTYIQQAPAPPADAYWYYCEQARAYYPYVKGCPGGWMKVVPQSAPPDR